MQPARASHGSQEPLGQATTDEYDRTGVSRARQTPKARRRAHTYDRDGLLTKIGYSDGTTPTSNTNTTPTAAHEHARRHRYDELRLQRARQLTETTNGDGQQDRDAYDLAGEETKITYPNGQPVQQTYDHDGRLHTVTDWLSNTTTFAYDPDSNLTTITFPSATNEQDSYEYNADDAISKVTMGEGSETLASLSNTRNPDGQLAGAAQTGLPANQTHAYDENGRLADAGATGYEYDAASNLKKIAEASLSYNEASELTSGLGASYTYSEQGERTKTPHERTRHHLRLQPGRRPHVDLAPRRRHHTQDRRHLRLQRRRAPHKRNDQRHHEAPRLE